VGKQRPLTRGMAVLVLALFAVFMVMIAVLFFWSGWGSMPLEKLPTLFWLMYITVAAGGVILDVAVIIRSADAYKNGRTPLIDIIQLVSGVIFVGGSFFGPAWTGGRLLLLAVGGFTAIQSGGTLIRAYLAKRRQTT
jgi:hypothetical protein